MKNWIFLGMIVLFIMGCKSTIYVANTDLTYNRVATLEDDFDAEIEQIILPYRKELKATMDEVIGELTVDLVKEKPESNIGNWLADMFFEEARLMTDGDLDFAVQNHGGVRVNSMGAGPITTGKVFEVMPFDNKVVIIKTDSSGLVSFLNHIAEGGGWPISKNLKFEIVDDLAVNITIRGLPIDSESSYSFAVPDYIANGGSGSNMLKSMERIEVDELIRDLFIRHIKSDSDQGVKQFAEVEGRITIRDHE